MAIIDVQNQKGEKVSQIDLPDSIFNVPVKPEVLHEIVVMQLAKRRAGTSSVKRRSDVSGSTRKLYRQKGTGRARRGDIKSPLMRGGGVVFGPNPRDYEYRIPKKKKKMAIKMALSSKFSESELMVIDDLTMNEIKTKKVAEMAQALKIEHALIVTEAENRNLELSARNIPGIKVLRSQGLNVYDILKYSNLVLSESAVKAIEGRLVG
ncbi:MAG: 50S ribosomal protein L4 [Thermodesulfobacteriota bacterium]